MWCTTRFNSVPLLFLVYVNDLNKASDVLDPLIFIDDTNILYFHQNIKTLFGTGTVNYKNV